MTQKFRNYSFGKSITANENLAKQESVFPAAIKNFGQTSEVAGRITFKQQDLIFCTRVVWVIRMSAEPGRASHQCGVVCNAEAI